MRVWRRLNFATSLRTTIAAGAAINDDDDTTHSDQLHDTSTQIYHDYML